MEYFFNLWIVISAITLFGVLIFFFNHEKRITKSKFLKIILSFFSFISGIILFGILLLVLINSFFFTDNKFEIADLRGKYKFSDYDSKIYDYKSDSLLGLKIIIHKDSFNFSKKIPFLIPFDKGKLYQNKENPDKIEFHGIDNNKVYYGYYNKLDRNIKIIIYENFNSQNRSKKNELVFHFEH